jgi:hypothetical protein
MATIQTEGKFPKRIGDFVLYRWEDKVVVKAVSGFTTAALKTAAHYELSRKNASEFGRVSSLCKQVRVALHGILPRQDNLAVVNAFTKKMREVMTCDTLNTRGERTLANALATAEGRQLLYGYDFNPEAKKALNYQIIPGALTLTTKGIAFPETANWIGFRMHQLVFDFTNGTSELTSSGWAMEDKATLRKKIDLAIPATPDKAGTVLHYWKYSFIVIQKAVTCP